MRAASDDGFRVRRNCGSSGHRMTLAIIEWNGLDLFTQKRREGGTVADKKIDAVTVVGGAEAAPGLDFVEKMTVDRYVVVRPRAKQVSERK